MLSRPLCFPTQDTDLVPSDIAAGFTLLHQQQHSVSHSREPQEVVTHTPGQAQVTTKCFRVDLQSCTAKAGQGALRRRKRENSE